MINFDRHTWVAQAATTAIVNHQCCYLCSDGDYIAHETLRAGLVGRDWGFEIPETLNRFSVLVWLVQMWVFLQGSVCVYWWKELKPAFLMYLSGLGISGKAVGVHLCSLNSQLATGVVGETEEQVWKKCELLFFSSTFHLLPSSEKCLEPVWNISLHL